MPKPALLKPNTIDEVNKKIIAKYPRVHAEHEFIGPQNKYRDEDYEIYLQKRAEFYKAAKKYHDLNEVALLNRKSKLDMFSYGILRYYPECECEALPKHMRCDDPDMRTGLLVRERTVRQIHQVNIEKIEVCSLEPWFKRYLKLCKFINAGRTIILKNRLLKNLAILRGLDEEAVAVYEMGHRKYENVAYADIFEKFMQ